MTCSDCLRPFSVPIARVEVDKAANETCVHCGQEISYFIHSEVESTNILPPTIVLNSHRRIQAAKTDLQEVKGRGVTSTASKSN